MGRGGGGNDGFLTPKAIAKRLKARGLGKQHLYCQLCRKQCRDDNGFKCHIESESHLVRMKHFEENQEEYIERFSREFEIGMMAIIKNSFRNKSVNINTIYNDYIRTRSHTRLNGTKWETLSDFAKYLGKTGKCRAEEIPGKGWNVTYIEKDPELVAKQEKLQKQEKIAKDEEEKMMKELEKRVKEAQRNNTVVEKTIPTELDFEKKKDIKFSLNLKKQNIAVSSDIDMGISQSPKKVEPKSLSETVQSGDSLHQQKRRKTEKFPNWIAKGIVVKVLHKELSNGKYYKQKGVIQELEDKFVAIVKMIESGHKLKLHQDYLETVIPQIGKKVRVLNGVYRGELGTLNDINPSEFQVNVSLPSGVSQTQLFEKTTIQALSVVSNCQRAVILSCEKSK